MADPKKNPLIGAFRAPVPGAPPGTPAPPEAGKPPAAGAAKPIDEKKGQEAPKAPAGTTPKPTDGKKGPEAPKAPADTSAKPADGKKEPEAPKAPAAPLTKPTNEKKGPEAPKAPADTSAKPADGKKGQEAPKAPAEEKESAGQPDTAKSQSDGVNIVSQIPVDEIMENSLFVAAENDPTFQMLVEDIRKNGLKKPININRTADGKYEVIDGNRRLAAAKKLGIKTINATVMNLPDKLKEKGQLHSNLDTFVNIDAHKKIDGSGGPRPSGPAEPAEGKKSPVSDPGKPKDGKKQEASKAPADTSAKPKEQEPQSPDLRFVALSKIKPLPGTYVKDEPRKDYSGLIADIKKNGLQKPVILRKSEKEDEFQLVDGFHRCKALEQAGMLEVRADVYEMSLAQASEYRKGHRDKPLMPVPGKLVPYPPEEPAKADKAPEAPAVGDEELPENLKIPLTKEGQPETVTTMKVANIRPFEGHPFAVRDNKDMWDLVDSIKKFGVLEPVMVIPHKDGGYEMVSGHRRMRACQLAGIENIPVIVRNLDRDEAIISMVDSNLKREEISPMEKARAYQMKTDAMKRKMGRRTKEEIAQDEALGIKRMNADEELAQQVGESPATIQRYKTLNKLVPELQDLVDKGKIPVNTGADIAQMKPKEQKVLADAIQKEDKVPSGTKAKELKKESQAGNLTTEKIVQAVAPTKREETPPLKVTMLEEDLRPFFPDKRTTIPDVKQGILEGLKLRQTVMERQKAKTAAAKKADTPVR